MKGKYYHLKVIILEPENNGKQHPEESYTNIKSILFLVMNIH